MGKYKYRYMDVWLPGDLFPGLKGRDLLDAMGHQAIEEAKERMTTWAIPAEWTARHVEGTPNESNEVKFRICRKSAR